MMGDHPFEVRFNGHSLKSRLSAEGFHADLDRRCTAAFGSPPDSFFKECSFEKVVAAVLLDLLRSALESLRMHLEDPKVAGATWTAPFIEAQYLIDWDWDWDSEAEGREGWPVYWPGDGGPEAQRRYNRFQETAPDESRSFIYAVLQVLTPTAAFEKCADDYTPRRSARGEKELQGLPEKEREAGLAARFAPYTIGAVEIEEAKRSEPSTWRGQAIEIPDELAAAQEKRFETLPRLTCKGHAEGARFAGAVVASYEALVLDLEELRAFYPVVLGLTFWPWAAPSTWSKEHRRLFWDRLFQALAKIRAELKLEKTDALPITPPTIARLPERALPIAVESPDPSGRTRADAALSDLSCHVHRIRLLPTQSFRASRNRAP